MGEVTGAVIATSLVLVAVFVPVAFSLGHDRAPLPAVLAHHRVLGRASRRSTRSRCRRRWRRSLLRAEREHRFALVPLVQPGLRGRARALPPRARLAARITSAGWRCRFVARPGLTVWLFRARPDRVRPRRGPELLHRPDDRPAGRLARLHDRHRQAGRRRGSRAAPRSQHVFSVLGFNFAGNGANRAIIFVSLSPVARAHGERALRPAVIGDMQRKLGGIPGAIVVPFLPPPIQGQGSTGGFTFELLDQGGGTDFEHLAEASQRSDRRGDAQRTRAAASSPPSASTIRSSGDDRPREGQEHRRVDRSGRRHAAESTWARST